MASLVIRIRSDRTRTKRLGSKQSTDIPKTAENTHPEDVQPGFKSTIELLELLYRGTPPGNVPPRLPDGLPTDKKVASAGISLLPWEMFIQEPRRLGDLLHVHQDQHISYKRDNVNALFEATFMDNPSFGDISSEGDSWIITTDTREELQKVRSLMTSRVSILGMSLARYTGKWRTSAKVPCLLMLDPDHDDVQELLDTAFREAENSLDNGKNFCIQINLNDCIEEWCKDWLETPCRSQGAKIILTNGDTYQPALSKDRLLCCVVCFPLWTIQACLYQIQRRSLYDDVIFQPNFHIRLQDRVWVNPERRHHSGFCNCDGCSRHAGCDRNPDKQNSDVQDSSLKITPRQNGGPETPRESYRRRKRKDKRNLTSGKENRAFESGELNQSPTTSTSSDPNSAQQDIADQSPNKQEASNEVMGNGMVASEMILTDSVQLVKFLKLRDQDLVKGPEEEKNEPQIRKDVTTSDQRQGAIAERIRRAEAAAREQQQREDSTDSLDSPKIIARGVGSSSARNQYVPKQIMFVRTGSQSRLSPDISSDSQSSSPQDSSTPEDSPSSNNTSRSLKKRHSKLFSKPKGILKEIRKTTDGVISRIVGNGIDEFQRTSNRAPFERPSSTIPGKRRSVRYDDETKHKNLVQKTSDSLSDEGKSAKMLHPDGEIHVKTTPAKTVVTVQPTNLPADSIKDSDDQLGSSTRNAEAQKTASNVLEVVAADGLVTNAWNFSQKSPRQPARRETTPTKQPPVTNPKSFLRPKAKVVFSTDEEDSDVDWRGSTSRLILVNGSKQVFDSTDLEKDTETDTEVSHFRLEDVGEKEINYLSDSHISVPSSNLNKTKFTKSRSKRNHNDPRRHQSSNLPRKRLYNPKKQSLSMLSLNTAGL